MSEIEMFSRHIKPGGKVTIGDDVFHFKPLPWKFMPQYWETSKALSKMMGGIEFKEGDEEDEKKAMEILESIDGEVIAGLLELEFQMVKESYPKMADDTLRSFCRDNMMALMTPLLQLNVPATDDQMRKMNYVNKRQSSKIDKQEGGSE